jgi:hypothetical protein
MKILNIVINSIKLPKKFSKNWSNFPCSSFDNWISSYNGLLLNTNRMDPQMHFAEWKRLALGNYISYDFTDMTFWKWKTYKGLKQIGNHRGWSWGWGDYERMWKKSPLPLFITFIILCLSMPESFISPYSRKMSRNLELSEHII